MPKRKSKTKAKADGAAPTTSAKACRAGNAPKMAPLPKATGKKNASRSSSKNEKVKKPAEALKHGQSSVKMAAKTQAGERDQVVAKYNIELSKKSLNERGFHPAVTAKTRDEIMAEWGAIVRKYTNLPTRETFLGGGNGFQGGVSRSRSLTRALLVLRRGFIQGHLDTDRRGAATENRLALMLNAIDIGGQIAQHVFADGYRTVQNAALTSTQSWFALAHSVKIWDFFAGDFCADGPGRVFAVVAPEYTIGEFQEADTYDPCGLDAANPLASWFSEAQKTETEIFVSIGALHRRLSKKRKSQPSLAPVTEELVAYTRRLRAAKSIHGSSQFKCGISSQLFDPSANFVVTRLRLMMKKIFEQRVGIKVLYFQKAPLVDRRILAIILRACPYVEMVGIYNCPLIHFGDVLCLLDLIHEINSKRRVEGSPLIKSLDFFPRYHEGMPFEHPWAQTYGLTWGPQKLDIVQRGFFCIVLKAFMKAKAMKLELLFSKNNAFCDFLFKIPNYSLAVPSFLDAMYRLVDLKRKKRRGTHNEHKQLLYDLLKPVRIDLEANISDDWPHWYTNIMGKSLIFCSSCGYEMLEDFFTAASRDSQPHTRVCAGCLLQLKLDDEGDHLKKKKTAILTTLFPEWDGKFFNHDAPLAAAARGIISLKATVSERNVPPPLIVNNHGNVHHPQFEQALVRDNKIHFDSLQNLPVLADLVGSTKAWRTVDHQSNNLDMYSRLVRRLREENRDVRDGGRPFECTRVDGGMPDHVEERQPPRMLQPFKLSRSFSNLVDLETMVYNNGWL